MLRVVAWGTSALVSLLALTMLVNLGAEVLGIDLFAVLTS